MQTIAFIGAMWNVEIKGCLKLAHQLNHQGSTGHPVRIVIPIDQDMFSLLQRLPNTRHGFLQA